MVVERPLCGASRGRVEWVFRGAQTEVYATEGWFRFCLWFDLVWFGLVCGWRID